MVSQRPYLGAGIGIRVFTVAVDVSDPVLNTAQPVIGIKGNPLAPVKHHPSSSTPHPVFTFF